MNTGLGHNAPPSDEQAFLSELESRNASLLERRTQLLEAAERAPKTIEDKKSAGKAADFIKQLALHEKAAENARKDEKEPYFQRGKWIDNYFKGPAIEGIAEVKKAFTARLTAYQKKMAEEERREREEEERRQREEARRAAEEAERQRREAEEAAKAAQSEEDLEAAIRAEEEAAVAARRMEERKAAEERAARRAAEGAADMSRQHSAAGTVASLRTSTKCTAWRRPDLDLDALRPYFADADIEKAIRGYIRAGGRELRGATIEEVSESRVA